LPPPPKKKKNQKKDEKGLPFFLVFPYLFRIFNKDSK